MHGHEFDSCRNKILASLSISTLTYLCGELQLSFNITCAEFLLENRFSSGKEVLSKERQNFYRTCGRVGNLTFLI